MLKRTKWQIGTVTLVLLIAIVAAFWFKTEIPGVPAASKMPELAENKEFTPEPYFPRRDLGVKMPVDVKINLLNEPRNSGDVAELELMFTSRLEGEVLTHAEFILPENTRQLSGDAAWSGNLVLNETRRLRLNVAVETDAPQSVQARVTVTKGENQLTVGAAYHLDLGEKDYAESVEMPVSGYSGADKLNLIIPKKKQ
jgi:hypothetical protein